MNSSRGPHFDWVESSVIEDIEVDFAKTFSCSEKESNLQITRWPVKPSDCEDDLDSSIQSRPVFGSAELSYFAATADICQIYRIRQKNSYSRLKVTRELFEQLLFAYAIFSRLWDFVLPFSFKTRESDLGHAPFRFRQTQKLALDCANLGSFECAYGFRYVVLNNRKQAMMNNPDYNPWSVRQCAVYQQFNSDKKRVTFILISPADITTENLEGAVQRRLLNMQQLSVFDLHRVIVSTMFENWRLYIRSLERLLKNQSDRVTLAQVRSETEQLSPLTDLKLNFVDRQRLKMIEDKILDLLIIFESLNNTISQLQKQCRAHCLEDRCPDCTCSMIIDELGEQIHEGEVNMKKAKILYKRAQGTAKLLSDLLDYENAQIAHRNGESLFKLAAQTAEENSKMRILTEKSTRDAAAVKILTIITLIYLPVTVVASIFSSQLIHVDDNGRISVVSESWWFAVITIPLTLVTFLAWQYWLSYTMRKQEHRVYPDSVKERIKVSHWFNLKKGGDETRKSRWTFGSV